MKKDNDLMTYILSFLFLVQVLTIVLKLLNVIKCSWIITLLPLLLFLGFNIVCVLIVIIWIIFGKDGDV